VVIACVLALAAAPLILTPGAPTYQAEALVVTRQLAQNERILPHLGEAVFANGAVAARVATDPAIGGVTRGLIPDRLSVVAPKDAVVFVVQARDTDPATAARLANLAGAAFVDELNRPGAGVGVFALQAQAVVPSEPLSTVSPKARAALGAVAGCILGLGLVALIAAVRRPVVTSHDVEGAAGVPLLGTVQLPRMAHGTYAGPLGVRGIATVTRWLATVPPGRLLIVSPPSAGGIRHRIYVMAAVALWTLRTVRFEAPGELIDAIREHCVEHREARRTVHPRPDAADELVLVDGGSAFEIIDPATTNVSVVAVAPLGASRRRLRALAFDYGDGGLVGVVLVDVRPGIQRAAARRARAAASAPATAGALREVSVPEPERA
jgi:hypothetical protein